MAPGKPGPLRETVLIVDDEPLIERTLKAQLLAEGYPSESFGSLASLRTRLAAPPPSLVLLDLHLPDGNGIDILPNVRAQWPETPIIVMTGHGSVESAVRAMRMGAYSYVEKPFNPEALSVIVRQALDTSRVLRHAEEEQRRNAERFSFKGVIAADAAMQRVVAQAQIVATSRAATILLLGESGTGKGILASSIHYASARATRPFLKVTCSAIPEALLEAELFGHEKGAFTDAKTRRRGVFEAADGGTVFLDEIGDMPRALQGKLLGVIEDRCFNRVGGTQKIAVDVRIIAATHRDLETAAEEGRFREDLLYRLKVVPLVIPALRERPADIPALAEAIVREFNHEFGRAVEGLEEDAKALLTEHTWPGNVRELRNTIERAMLFTHARRLAARDLMLETGYRPRLAKERSAAALQGPFVLPAEGILLDEVEQDLVRQALERAGGNQSRAAALLGMSRDQIRYRLEKMGLLAAPRSREPESRVDHPPEGG
ncbi:MAG: sigma-54-dependent transcriptional regulator [Planctomycetaceae bacterium]